MRLGLGGVPWLSSRVAARAADSRSSFTSWRVGDETVDVTAFSVPALPTSGTTDSDSKSESRSSFAAVVVLAPGLRDLDSLRSSWIDRSKVSMSISRGESATSGPPGVRAWKLSGEAAAAVKYPEARAESE